jgi:DNA-binding NarL/FixJ family response regulator/predicted negative regulator of RcsB-dependent stress response
VGDMAVADEIFCVLLSACERARDVARAEQWMRTVAELAHRLNLKTMAALCRAHYGGVLTDAGRWAEAEQQLLAAADLFAASARSMAANAAVRLADLRVRQGRYEEAAVLLAGLEENPDAARPLAALYMARGDVALARDRVQRALSNDGMAAGAAAPLLALLVDIELASGDHDAARGASVQLAELARLAPVHYLVASAALARGKVCVATGDGNARSCLVEALAAFSRAAMPVELARARVELAKAVAADQPEVAVAEASAALRAFEELQSRRDADAALAVLRSLGRASPPRVRAEGAGGPTLTRREAEVLQLLGFGLSNPEIADRLYISRKTVEHHVGRILAKLGLRSRAEAAAHAARTEIPGPA